MVAYLMEIILIKVGALEQKLSEMTLKSNSDLGYLLMVMPIS